MKGTGQENGGGGNTEVNERRGAIAVLASALKGRALLRVLPHENGRLSKLIRTDLRFIARAERQKLERGKPFDLAWAANGTSTKDVLEALADRRALAAEASARALSGDPRRAHDASNDCMLAHLATRDREVRARILADTLIQFRAKRRSRTLIDRRERAQSSGSARGSGDARRSRDNRGSGDARDAVDVTTKRDSTEGRLASSGVLSTFEQRLACQEVSRGTALDERREYALARLAIANHPHGSTNGVFHARTCVALLADDRYLGAEIRARPVGAGDGLGASLYDATHKNYSANTPKIADHFVRHRVFTGGPVERRIAILGACVEAARTDDVVSSRARLEQLERLHGYVIPECGAARTMREMKRALLAHLAEHTDLPRLRRLKEEDRLVAYETLLNMHAAMVTERPSDRSLQEKVFYAGSARNEVAAVIHAMRSGDHLQAVHACGRARARLRTAFHEAESGFDRQMLWRIDRQVELLSAELLGVSVSRAETLEAPRDLAECLVAVESALRGTLASGLDAIRRSGHGALVPGLPDLLLRLETMIARGRASIDEIRDLLGDIFRSASETAEAVRAFFHERETALHFSDIDVRLDPEFTDNLIKETGLHYLLALAQSGMSYGLESEVSPDRIAFVTGMRVLNSVGPTVYRRILVARDMEQLLRLGPTHDDFCVVHKLDEKSLVAMGGLLADTADAPGGYSHLAVFAKGHGISAFALPNLSHNYVEFLKNVARGGGLFVDDRSGSFVMMPLDRAIHAGLVAEGDVERLRPGFNRHIKYLEWEAGAERLVAEHHARVSDARPTREIELFVPLLERRDASRGVPGFADLLERPLDETRHVAGEKGAVLARLSGLESLRKLGVGVPEGAAIAPFEIVDLLREARAGDRSLYDLWMSTWTHDPRVAEVTSKNFLESEFYGNRPYRLERAKQLRKAVRRGLSDLLIRGGKPTKRGAELLDAIRASSGLSAGEPWIARSSFTGEDRPNKSGAGQYESFPDLRNDKERLEGIIGVIASSWGDRPVENNVQFQIDLREVWPSVLVQRSLRPSVSGVAVSRGPRGSLGEVSYQAVRGFGGGVAGGRPEEGVIREDGRREHRSAEGKRDSFLTAEQAKTLREAVLAIEREFHARIEPGKGYAVDVEWAIENEKLYIVQARVLADG